jgi:hypothetical protein
MGAGQVRAATSPTGSYRLHAFVTSHLHVPEVVSIAAVRLSTGHDFEHVLSILLYRKQILRSRIMGLEPPLTDVAARST